MRRLTITLLSIVSVVALVILPSMSANAATWQHRRAAVRVALHKRGHPYAYGAVGPWAFDCSGLVYFAEHRAGQWRTPRTAAEQYRFLRHIPLRKLRRGDLIFDHTRSGHVFHVEIYLGHGRVIEAQRPGRGVRVARVWKVPRWAATYRGVNRRWIRRHRPRWLHPWRWLR